MEAKIKAVSLLFILLSLVSCSVSKSKKGDGRIIKGNYEIIKTEKANIGKAQIVCIVFDKKDNFPIPNAVVEINELKLGGFTSDKGIFSIEIPKGKYTITVVNTGNANLITSLITVNPGDIIYIKFELGTTIIYSTK